MTSITKTVYKTVEVEMDITIDESDLRNNGIIPIQAGHMSLLDMANRIDDALGELSLLGSKNFWLQKELETVRDAICFCRH